MGRRPLVAETALPSAPRGIMSCDVWATARHLDLYGMSDAELVVLIARHRSDPLSVNRVAAAAACYVVRLRRGMAAGAAC
jgi:hypothetical protein